MNHLGRDKIVPRHASGKQGLRLSKGRLRATELTQDPLGISKIGIRPRPKIEHPVGVIGILKVLRDFDAQLGKVDRATGILKGGVEALLEQELAEPPGLEGLVVGHQAELLVEREGLEPGEELRRLPPLQNGYPLVPMVELFLQPKDLLVLLPALRTPFQEMGNDLPEEVFMTEIPRQQSRQGFDGWMNQATSLD
ncbi:MAG TPA: hypothetical protein VGH73_16585 [Thermoanaerobaculia bacterium]